MFAAFEVLVAQVYILARQHALRLHDFFWRHHEYGELFMIAL